MNTLINDLHKIMRTATALDRCRHVLPSLHRQLVHDVKPIELIIFHFTPDTEYFRCTTAGRGFGPGLITSCSPVQRAGHCKNCKTVENRNRTMKIFFNAITFTVLYGRSTVVFSSQVNPAILL